MLEAEKSNAQVRLAEQPGHLQGAEVLALMAQILAQPEPVDKLRQSLEVWGDWAPRKHVAAILQKHEDTLARACVRHGIPTRHALAHGRCRVELFMPEVVRVFCGDTQ